MDAPAVHLLGDGAVIVTFGESLSDDINDRVTALAAALRAQPLSQPVHDIVPAIASLAVHFDSTTADAEQMRDELHARAAKFYPVDFSRLEASADVPTHEIPVRYGGADGPDLEDVARFAGITPGEVIERHARRVYRVFMLGFLPGFAYLGQVDPSIAAPRRPAPRQEVPAGSVGIAGRQTGVYPQKSPGGWQLIGRTPLPMFDVEAGRSRLQAGDRVRFVPERL